jgi:hypothetical protein
MRGMVKRNRSQMAIIMTGIIYSKDIKRPPKQKGFRAYA